MGINQRKKILLITSGQPSLNPRLIKEADTLINAGYDVMVLYSYWNDWGHALDKALLESKKWKSLCIGGNPQNKGLTFIFSQLIHKGAKIIVRKVGLIGHFPELAIARGSFFLMREAKKHKADLYIGHNLGALPAIVKAARRHRAKYSFDAEDFHRQEIDNNDNSCHFKLSKCLEDRYLKDADYFSVSSPQIAKAYQQLYPNLNPVSIRNVFPINKDIKQRIINTTRPIRLFWFSQTIGISRGLNDIAKALEFLKAYHFELHLLGYIPNEYKQQFIDSELNGMGNVFFHPPVPPDELIYFASQFDIGLAVERSEPLNRDICLTNKIFTYLLAGLAIVASDTAAQTNFLNENPTVGDIYQKDDLQSLVDLLSNYYLNRNRLFDTCESSLKIGVEQLNWENESQKFKNLVKQTLHSD